MSRKCCTTCSVCIYACMYQKANSMGTIFFDIIHLYPIGDLSFTFYLWKKFKLKASFTVVQQMEKKVTTFLSPPSSKQIILILHSYILKNQTITCLFYVTLLPFPIYLILWQNFCLWTSVGFLLISLMF